MTRVYFDLDNVLADFLQAVRVRGVLDSSEYFHRHRDTWSQDEVLLDNKITAIMDEPGFFKSIPMVAGAKKMWDLYRGSRGILTAYPRGAKDPERVTKEKFEWCRDRLGLYGDDTFICCLRSEKNKYATNKGVTNILVDDLEVNCNEWVEAGGEAVLFKGDIARTVRIVDRLLDVI